MQDRLLRRPRQRQAGKGAKGRRIFQIKGQFLVTELPLLLQERAAQHRFRRQPPTPGLAQTLAPQIGRYQAHQRALPIEHDKALARVIIGLMKDDTELFKQYQDNPDFSRWLADTVFNMTYDPPGP